MQWNKFLRSLVLCLALSSTAWSQQSQPNAPTAPAQESPPVLQKEPTPPAPAPNEKSTESTEIPVVKMGEQIKPEVQKAPPAEKTKGSSAPIRVEEVRTLVVESRQLVHSKNSEVGDTVYFTVSENAPDRNPIFSKGALILGKITEIEKIKSNNPGRLKINLDQLSTTGTTSSAALVPFSGTIEISREKGEDGIDGKEIFLKVGAKKKISLSKKMNLKSGYRPLRPKPMKGTLSASAETGEATVSVKLGYLKYPSKIDVYIEPPKGLSIEDLDQDSLKLVRINDFYLPTPILPIEGKIRVADHNENQVEDLGYSLKGWHVVQYLPEGASRLYFSALTKKGKPIEATATVRLEHN